MSCWTNVSRDTGTVMRQNRGASCTHAVHSNDTPPISIAARWHRRHPPSQELISSRHERRADHLTSSTKWRRAAAVDQNLDQILDLNDPPRRYAIADAEPLTESERMEAFQWEARIPAGRLSVAPLVPEHCSAAALLLTRAFAGFPEGQTLSSVTQYMMDMLEEPPNAILLVAHISPTDPSRLPPGWDSRLVATASISFTRSSRENFATLQPPDETAYLSNMAVDPSFRREGIARAVLVACEAICLQSGFKSVTLHARVKDDVAIALYLSCGYREVARDGLLVALQRVRPRLLMQKEI